MYKEALLEFVRYVSNVGPQSWTDGVKEIFIGFCLLFEARERKQK